MRIQTWQAVVFRAALAVLAMAALAACGAKQGATDAERLARGRDLVKQMSSKLASATGVSVTTMEQRDMVRGAKKETVSLTGSYTLRRPDRFYTKMTGGRGLESWYNGKTLTIASHQHKVFAQAPMPESIDRALDALAERYDMALPMGDLFYGSAEKALLSETTTGGYVGTENVGDTPCSHLVFKDVGVEWALWIPVQGEPLPKRFKVTQTKRTGQPTVDVTFTAWDIAPQTSDATFVPKVPADYEGIAILQRAAAVKRTAAASPAAAPAGKK